jgi:hypothetical protein
MEAALSLFKSDTTLATLMASIRLPDPPSPLEYEIMRTHLVTDPMHPPLSAVLDHGSQHVTFVDDNMISAERDAIPAVINASVLSAYFLYGLPGDDRCPPPLGQRKIRTVRPLPPGAPGDRH